MAGHRDLNPLSTSKIGKLTTDQLFPDPSRWVAQILGGREFFFEIGAHTVHRLGLMSGLGFRLPKGSAKDYIDKVDIRFQPDGRYTCTFGVADPHPEATGFHNVVREVCDVPMDKLREVYDANT